MIEPRNSSNAEAFLDYVPHDRRVLSLAQIAAGRRLETQPLRVAGPTVLRRLASSPERRNVRLHFVDTFLPFAGNSTPPARALHAKFEVVGLGPLRRSGCNRETVPELEPISPGREFHHVTRVPSSDGIGAEASDLFHSRHRLDGFQFNPARRPICILHRCRRPPLLISALA